MVGIAKKTERHPSDLADEELSSVAPVLPQACSVESPRRVDLREIMNAIRYPVRSGFEWRMLPMHFPPRQTVYRWFRRLARRPMFQTIHDRRQLMDKAAVVDVALDIVERTAAAFVPLPCRWVVERTLGGVRRHRRLVRDHGARIEVSEATIHIVMGGSIIRRIGHQ